MLIPLSVLDAPSVPEEFSLGEHLGHCLSKTDFQSLVQCLCEGADPAIHSSEPGRPPLLHDDLRAFISDFVLPHSAHQPPWKRNDRVMVVLPAGPENALALLALANYHTCAPVNANCTATELKDDALRLQVKAIITVKDMAKRLELESLQAELNCQIFYICGRDSGPAGLFDLFVPEGTDTVIPSRPTEPHGLDDISLILHTSGTSGKKKVVRYSLRTLLVGAWCIVRSWDLKPNDVNLNMMPLFHVGGVMRNLLAPILSGGSSITCNGFDSNEFWSLAVRLRPTWYYAAPTIHHALLSTKPDSIVPSRDLHIRLICNAAGGLLPSLATELKDVFGAVVLPSYGMTECMPIATPLTDYQLDRPGCSGIPCGPSVSIREIHDLEQELPMGRIGAICVRGLPTFDGYEVSPATEVPLDRSAFSSEGWFDSGDVGYLDEDGYLYITGRSKEIINKGGEVVSPFEVEEAIITVAKGHVKSALAFSIEHDVLQEAIGVVIISEEGRSRLSLQQLHELLKGHLHPSKWPFAVVYMGDIPKNSTGKPLRINLAKLLGIGALSDNTPPLRRHFEATLPSYPQLIDSESIPCTTVTIGVDAVENVLRSHVPGVDDVALRRQLDESLEAYVSVAPLSKLVLPVSDIIQSISALIPGYAIPNRIYIIHGPLVRDLSGNPEYERMQMESLNNEAIDMNKRQLLIRDIFADILHAEPAHLRKDSDFFLLGGNSLLLGKLSHHVRKRSRVNVGIAELFSNSTIQGIATLIEERGGPDVLDGRLIDHDQETRRHARTTNSSVTALSMDHDFDHDPQYVPRGRSQNHPLCLVIQAIPFFVFYPLKAALTWSCILVMFSRLLVSSPWHGVVGLFASILVAHVVSRIVCPVTAIAFKWIVIGRYQPGSYQMWSIYYLRWWIVNQSLKISGLGIFALHPSLTVLYYRLLGARIGKDVHIGEMTELHECDLLTLQDGCHLDTATLRGFCVERDSHFRLEPITIGRNAFVNTYTSISPGFRVPDGSVYGPHASSYDAPSPQSFTAYNQTLLPEPLFFLKLFIAWPIIGLVMLTSYIPWMLAIYAMVDLKHIQYQDLVINDLDAVINWFISPKTVLFHALSRVVRALFRPLIQLAFGILVKRAFGLNRENATSSTSQIVLLRRYINSILLSPEVLEDAFLILGMHYEMIPIVYRAMGAKIGQRIYWPGGGIQCSDPELLEIGDDVVFGSHSVLITTDKQGTGKIVIENGAMIADRVVLLPGTHVGTRAVMGSGALGKRNGIYRAGSTWIGNDKGEAICLNTGLKEQITEGDTIKPFGKAYYKRETSFYVFPYIMILAIGATMAAFSAMYWSLSAVGSAQILKHIQIQHLQVFAPRWYRFGILYALISMCFAVILSAQGIISALWVIATKWALMGRRTPGRFDWDQSSYCQRWQLHLILLRLMFKGFGDGGVLDPLTGSAYIVWCYRAFGATIGENCGLWVGGKAALMTEPDLVEIGDHVNLDDCSVVAHLNSRGRFTLNRIKIGNRCTMRSGSRILPGASMEDNSMLCEHTLLTSGDVADSGVVYVGWPAKRLEDTIDDTVEKNFKTHS